MDGLQTIMASNGLNTLIYTPNQGPKVKKDFSLLIAMRVINHLSLSTTAFKTTSLSFGCLHIPRIYFSRSILVALARSKLHTRSRSSTWSKTISTTSLKSSFYRHSRRLLTKHSHLAISKEPLEAPASFYSILRLCYLN
jgi:hypothetical protein